MTTASYNNIVNNFSPVITGQNINAILTAISVGDEILRYNSQNLYLNLFVKTAVGPYLDILGNNSGIQRPSAIGISDLAYSQIIATTINQQNDVNALLNVLNIYFSPFQTKAYITTSASAPFTLNSGDNLTIQVDNINTYNITFNSADFNNIGSISATDLANVITTKLAALNSTAFAIPSSITSAVLTNVSILSSTLGSASAIAVVGGKANNTLKFSQFISTTQNNTTQFTIQNYSSGVSGLSGITTRFLWSGGTNPTLSSIAAGNYVNIYGNEFNSANQGTFIITNVVNGPVNLCYFEIQNSSSVTQSVTLANATDINFFNPVKQYVGNQKQYATVFEAVENEVDIFIPASTAVISRTPTTGGGYLADVYTYVTPTSNVSFTLSESVIGLTSLATGILISITTNKIVLGDVTGKFVSGETIRGESTSVTTNISSLTKTLDDPFFNNYIVDFNDAQITKYSSNLSMSIIAEQQLTLLTINSTTNFNVTGGYLRIDMGQNIEEDIVPYTAILSPTTILLDSSYQFKYGHSVGADVTFIVNKNFYTSPADDSDLACYVTDVAQARQSAIDSLNTIESAGIQTNVTVLYPGDTGFGNAGTDNSDIIRIYGV